MLEPNGRGEFDHVVYFIEAVGANYIKIGYISLRREPKESLRIAKLRAKGMQVGCPFKLEVIGLAYQHTEKELHGLFANARVRGEWFKATPELRRFIANNTKAARCETCNQLITLKCAT